MTLIVFVSCKKDELKIPSCNIKCDITLEENWTKDIFEVGDKMLFSPVIQGEKIILGSVRYPSDLTITAVNKKNGEVLWRTNLSYGIVLKYRFYEDYLVVLYIKRSSPGKDYELTFISLKDGSFFNHQGYANSTHRYVSLDQNDIIYADKDADNIYFYNVNIKNVNENHLLVSLKYDSKDYKSLGFRNFTLFDTYDNNKMFVAINRFENISYQFDLKNDTIYIVDLLLNDNHCFPNSAMGYLSNRMFVFDCSQILMYGPSGSGIGGTIPIRYHESSYKWPLIYDYDRIMLNTSDKYGDIVVLHAVSQSIEKRYINMGKCLQLKLIDEGILVTCDGSIILLDHDSDKWLWRTKSFDKYKDKVESEVLTSPVMDTENKDLFFVRGNSLVCAKWPE